MYRKFILLAFLLFYSCSSNSNISIHFTIDKTYDIETIVQRFRTYDPAGLESRSQSMGINYEYAKKISKMDSFDATMEVGKLVNSKYKEDLPKIQNSVNQYQKSWNKIIRYFSKEVVHLTQHQWFYRKYICVVSAFSPGLTSSHGNKVVRVYNLNPDEQRRITAHEIVLSHILHILRENYTASEIDPWTSWALGEITTVFILDEGSMMPLWKNYSKVTNYFSTSNYPQLTELEDKLKVIYNSKKDFKDYLDKSILLLKNEKTSLN